MLQDASDSGLLAVDPSHRRSNVVEEPAADHSADFAVRVGLLLQGVQHVLFGKQGEEGRRSATLIHTHPRVQRHDHVLVRVGSPLFVLIVPRLHVYL